MSVMDCQTTYYPSQGLPTPTSKIELCQIDLQSIWLITSAYYPTTQNVSYNLWCFAILSSDPLESTNQMVELTCKIASLQAQPLRCRNLEFHSVRILNLLRNHYVPYLASAD